MTPGDCPNETRRWSDKSYCEPWERWTNCRCVGRCVYESTEPKWARVDESPNYEVSTTGEVRNAATGKLLKQAVNFGYSYVSLQINGKSHRRRVHRLVAKAFIPNPESKTDVNHIDGDKANNRVENLEWCTASENLTHAYQTGLRSRDASCAYTKRRKKVVRDDGVVFGSVSKAAESLGVTVTQMSKILRGARRSRDGRLYEYESANNQMTIFDFLEEECDSR